MTYSAYLGGHMVYEHGVGVKKADGIRKEEAPHLLPGQAQAVLQTSAQHLVQGVRHAVEDLARGEVLPWLTRGGHSHEQGEGALMEPVGRRAEGELSAHDAAERS